MRLTVRREARGSASLEVIALTPLLMLVALYALQLGVVAWATGVTQEAAREAARASSLGRDPSAAAAGSLPGALGVVSVGVHGPGHAVTLVVDVPRVAPLPRILVTREAVLP